MSPGTDEEEVHARTHLGNILECGDYALGFDVDHAVVNNGVFDKLKQVGEGASFLILVFSG